MQESAMTRRSRIMMIWTVAIVLLTIGTVLQVKADPAAIPGTIDVAEGDRLAHTLCINCHIVDTRGPLVRTDRVPSFPWVAQQPGLTPEFVSGWLSTSHERMPDYTLTREEIRQLTAYIFSLRKQ
jgi:mono/diheme cytochrome c family protein